MIPCGSGYLAIIHVWYYQGILPSKVYRIVYDVVVVQVQ